MARALGYEFGELSLVKREGGFIRGSHGILHPLFTQICCTFKKNCPVHFCSIPISERSEGESWLCRWKARPDARENSEAEDFYSSPLLPVQFSLTLLLSALSLIACLMLSVLSGDSGNLKLLKVRSGDFLC